MLNKLKEAVKNKAQQVAKKLTGAERQQQKEMTKLHNAHMKMLEVNVEIAKVKYKEFVDVLSDLGFQLVPTLEKSAMIPGHWIGLIQLKHMTQEKYDRHMNPEKWAEIDKERQAATEQRQKDAEARMKKEQEEKSDEPEPTNEPEEIKE